MNLGRHIHLLRTMRMKNVATWEPIIRLVHFPHHNLPTCLQKVIGEASGRGTDICWSANEVKSMLVIVTTEQHTGISRICMIMYTMKW